MLLGEMNTWLKSRVYLAGVQLTLADVALFAFLSDVMVSVGGA